MARTGQDQLARFAQVATGRNCTPIRIIHRRIQLVRRFRGISIEQLASRTRMSVFMISAIEKFKFPTAPQLRFIADALGVSTDFLLGRQVHPIQDRDQSQPITAPNEAVLVALRVTKMDGSPIWQKDPDTYFAKRTKKFASNT